MSTGIQQVTGYIMRAHAEVLIVVVPYPKDPSKMMSFWVAQPLQKRSTNLQRGDLVRLDYYECTDSRNSTKAVVLQITLLYPFPHPITEAVLEVEGEEDEEELFEDIDGDDVDDVFTTDYQKVYVSKK
jgi:hypothetical protein